MSQPLNDEFTAEAVPSLNTVLYASRILSSSRLGITYTITFAFGAKLAIVSKSSVASPRSSAPGFGLPPSIGSATIEPWRVMPKFCMYSAISEAGGIALITIAAVSPAPL